MSKLKIERIGGLAGFGGKKSHIRSTGEVDINELTKEDRKAIEDLFKSQDKADGSLSRDTFRYRISRTTSEGTESIEAGEEKIPGAVKKCVKDEII